MSNTPPPGQMMNISVVDPSTPAVDVVRSVLKEDQEDPFYVVDLGKLYDLYREWHKALPGVQPFYAVKCNNDPAILSVLAKLGAGFDCASKEELRTVLSLGVAPDRIIYANPCKQISHIKYAASCGVKRMTFDNKIELSKMAKAHPGSELVLRIKADDSSALCRLGCKFGATLPEAFSLLDTAKEMNLNVIGVSFHIGSGSSDPTAYSEAIKMARGVFHHGTSLGFNFTLLDIGGGFPGDSTSTALFTEMARSINVSLKECFADVKDLAVVAEPGRFFATSTHTLAVCVTSKKEELIDGEKVFKYYVNDGVYGSFNCVIFDHTTPRPKTVCLKNTQHFKCSVWGPTCDGLDLIVDDRVLPEVNIGDWLFFEDMGAYTMSASSTFNGFPKPCSFYYTTNPDILEECPLGNVLAQDGYHKSELMPLVLDDVYRVEQLVS